LRHFLILGSLLALQPAPAVAAPLELKSTDRLVLIGSTLIEREQRYGYWEAMLTARVPGLKVRNLGWSGDDVYGTARRAFDLDKPDIGRKRLVELTTAEKPTVIVICYGANESFAGEAELKKFSQGYEKLLDELAPAKAQIILMAPPPFEEKGPPLPDLKKQNVQLGIYREAIKHLAGERKFDFVDLDAALGGPRGMADMTDDGVHLTAQGYARSAGNFLRALGFKVERDYTLDLEPLRQAIRKKNELYFYRWRPQNETYLFGFRKHEQGRTARK